MLIDKLREDLKSAMKNKETAKKSVLQLLIASFTKFEKENKTILTPDDEITLLNRELKQVNETLDYAIKFGRQDSIEEETIKANLIKTYLPPQLSEDEVKEIIQTAIKNLGISAPSKTNDGKIMKEIMPKLKGKADGKLINRIVTELLVK